MKHQLLGKKIGMTQVYDGENNLVPVTVVQAGPCPVTQVKTKATDGYNAVQIAFGAQKESRLSAGEVGHLRKAGVAPHSHLHEIRLADDAKGDVAKVGDVITVEKFTAGQMVASAPSRAAASRASSSATTWTASRTPTVT